MSAPDAGTRHITDRGEVLFILRTMQRRRTLLTAQSPGGDAALVTSIAGMSPSGDVVYFETGRDAGRLEGRSPIVVTGSNAGAPVKFVLERLARTRHEGRPALASPLPRELWRVQRREHFRVATRWPKPPVCAIGTGEEQPLEVPVVDLSCGGIALMERPVPPALELGKTYGNCSITLPGNETLAATLEIRNVHEVTGRDGRPGRRIGCRFVGLADAARARLNRLVLLLERLGPPRS